MLFSDFVAGATVDPTLVVQWPLLSAGVCIHEAVEAIAELPPLALPSP